MRLGGDTEHWGSGGEKARTHGVEVLGINHQGRRLPARGGGGHAGSVRGGRRRRNQVRDSK